MNIEEFEKLAFDALVEAVRLIHKNKGILLKVNNLGTSRTQPSVLADFGTYRFMFSIDYPNHHTSMSFGSKYWEGTSPIYFPCIEDVMPIEQWKVCATTLPEDKFRILCIAAGVYEMGRRYYGMKG